MFGNRNVTEYIFVQPTLVYAGAGYIFYFSRYAAERCIKMTNALEFVTSIVCDADKRYNGREYYPICVGMSEPQHTVKRFAERGGVYDGTVCMDALSEEFAQYPKLIDELLELHQIIEGTNKSVVVRLPDKTVYVLQYAGFSEDYTELFDFVTFFNENYCGKKFFVRQNEDVFVNVDVFGQVKRCTFKEKRTK